MAPGADILAVRADSGRPGQRPGFWTDDLAFGLDHVVNVIDAGRPVAAVNISIWDGGVYNDENPCPTELWDLIMQELVNQLANRHTATVIISGNGGRSDGVSSPGCIPGAVTVGATEDAGSAVDTIAGASNSSPLVDLVAPGYTIMSSILDGQMGPNGGTSMAAPHVAGAFAIYRERYGYGADVDTVLARMQASGPRILDGDNGLTFSRLDVSAAQAAWGFVFSHDPSPSAPYSPAADYQANSTGALNTVSPFATGIYFVEMPGLGNGEQDSGDRAGGNVQVNTFGLGRDAPLLQRRPPPVGHVLRHRRGLQEPHGCAGQWPVHAAVPGQRVGPPQPGGVRHRPAAHEPVL